MKRIYLSVAAVVLLAQPAFAGGFQIGEMATRAAGMGSAFTAVADDASAAWFNPAGTVFMDSNQAMLGGDVIMTNNKFTSNTSNLLAGPGISADAASKTLFVPHGYLTYRWAGTKLGASLGINSPFGLETDWPTTSPFAPFYTFSRINMVMINPSVAYQISDNLSIAAGVDYADAYKLNLNNTNQDLSGNGDGWGGNVSLLYKGNGFNVGITYRSRIKIGISGTATAKGGLVFLGAGTSGVDTSITLPDQVNVGLAVMPNAQWLLSLDVDWVNWKTFDALNITYGSAAYRAALTTATGSGSTHLPMNWKATVAFRLGAEWKYSRRARVRFGFVYDPTPINATDFAAAIPGNDRQLYSIGYGYDITPATTLDLGYDYVHFDNRNQTQSPGFNTLMNGNYKGYANLVMASVDTRF